jgi:hypothetical protein
MLRISVYEDDPFRWCADLAPDVTAAAQRRVTADEHAELLRLEAEYKKFQALLAKIRERPELEFDEIWSEECHTTSQI